MAGSETKLLNSPSGDLVEVPAGEALKYHTLGYTPVTEKQLEDKALQEKYGGATGQLHAVGEGIAQSLTAGLSDVALQPDPGYRAANPGAYMVGQGVGVVAPALLTGGASAAGQGAAKAGVGGALRTAAEYTAPSLISRAGTAAAEMVGTHLPQATSVAGRVAQSALKAGVGSAVEGAYYSAGNVVSEAALGNPDEVAQSAFAEIGLGAALGFGLGGLTGAAAEGLPIAGHAMANAVEKKATSIRDYMLDKYPQYASQMTGTSEDTVKFLIENRALMDPKSAANDALQKGFAVVVQDARDVEGQFGKAFNTDIGPGERKLSAAQLGATNEAIDTEANRLLQLSDSTLQQMKGSPEFAASSAAGLERARNELATRVTPQVEPVVNKLADISERILKDPSSSEYGQLTGDAKRAWDRVNSVRESLPGLPGSELGLAGQELQQAAQQLPQPLAHYANELMSLGRTVHGLNISPAEKLEAVLAYKKTLGDYIPYGANRLALSQAERNAMGAIQRVQGAVRDSLHNPGIWGEAGSRMAATDAAQHELIMARTALEKGGSKLFSKRADGTMAVDPTKVKAWFRKMGDFEGAGKLEDLKDYLAASKNFAEEFKKSYSVVPRKGLDPTSLESVINKTGDITEQFRRQATAQRIAKELAPHGGGLGGVGEAVIGNMIGGHVGSAIGALHALYGFSKNVPAAVATLTTLERVAAQVNRAVQSNASTLARGGVKAATVLRGEVAAGIAHHFAHDNETATKRYNKSVAMVRSYANDPAKMQEALTRQTEGWQDHAPKIAQAFQATTVRAVQHLAKACAAPPPAGPLAAAYRPSRSEISEYNRRLEVIENPVALLRQAAVGNITPEAIQAVKEVHPQLYATMVGQTLAKVADLGVDKLTYHARLMLSMLTGMDLDGSTKPMSMMANQMVYAFPQPEAPQQGVGPGMKSKKFTIASRMQTPQQAVENGEKA